MWSILCSTAAIYIFFVQFDIMPTIVFAIYIILVLRHMPSNPFIAAGPIVAFYACSLGELSLLAYG